MTSKNIREIPYNYTSADDQQVVNFLFGESVWDSLEKLRTQRVTGRSAKLLMRFMGDLFILRRNPFLYQDLIDSDSRRDEFFSAIKTDLNTVEQNASGNSDVKNIVDCCQQELSRLTKSMAEMNKRRSYIRTTLAAIVGKDNIFFDPFSLVSHATDATDWRLYLPLAVVRPTEESQVAPLLATLRSLKLGVIPRGAGTGLTGGSVPVSPDTVILNVEKLNSIRSIEYQKETANDGTERVFPFIELEAGVITDDAMDYAAKENLVFATDPTSAWASTIGGNIAENAGGKTAVLWGTAIDNILSYKIAMPHGKMWEVTRVNHPLKKIEPDDEVIFTITENGKLLKGIKLRGDQIRKRGLWKDITNKCLSGVPGLQKEGTDGVITSARFVLHQAYEEKQTCCLEFFGESFDEASRVILQISQEFINEGEEALVALEHFDEEYVKAIKYKVKAPKNELPKAVLLIDIVGHNKRQLIRGTERLQRLLDDYQNTYIFTARDKKEADLFWQDRKKLGAIASRTNAFKLNEDIVLPLNALAAFSRFADEHNIEEERYNQLRVVEEILVYLEQAEPLETPELLSTRKPKLIELCQQTIAKLKELKSAKFRDSKILAEFESKLLQSLQGYNKIRDEITKIVEAVKLRLIVIATHMHAGDGNIHVNIPVLSNDQEMMTRAMLTADVVMDKAVELGGVVSGEHGIGITKLKYLEAEKLKELNDYRKEVDPTGIMNPGKLADLDVPNKVFTPSFNLLELEAQILQRIRLKELAEKIANCVRCGKCKANCCTFYPAQNMFYHPRNKNLAIGSLIEALLYSSQRSRSTKFESLKHLEEIADHCTICHKCYKPCPVDIDTGEVSILEREILSERNYKHTAAATTLSLKYLENRSQLYNTAFRQLVLRYGSQAQRTAHKIMSGMGGVQKARKGSPLALLKSPMTPVPAKTLWDHMPLCSTNEVLVLNPEGEAKASVFYFPGCGSERMFSDISAASVYLLLKSGTRVVLPPPYLCCGTPSKVNAKQEQHSRILLRNSIIFTQIRNMLGYVDFDACLVSCGTCMEGVQEVEIENIFDCELMDISRFALKQGISIDEGENYLYHPPCHDSLKGEAVNLLTAQGYQITNVPSCCSEAGTMSLSRPDITSSMLDRKAEKIKTGRVESSGAEVVLTNCPSCLQGLGRNSSCGIKARHIAVELAEKVSEKNWREELKQLVKNNDLITF